MFCSNLIQFRTEIPFDPPLCSVHPIPAIQLSLIARSRARHKCESTADYAATTSEDSYAQLAASPGSWDAEREAKVPPTVSREIDSMYLDASPAPLYNLLLDNETTLLSYCTYDAVWYNIVWLLPTLRQNYPIKITINAAIISEIIKRVSEWVRVRDYVCVENYGFRVRVKGCAVQLQNPNDASVCLLPKFPLPRVCVCEVRWCLIVGSYRIGEKASSRGGKSKKAFVVPPGWKAMDFPSFLFSGLRVAAEATRREKKIARNRPSSSA